MKNFSIPNKFLKLLAAKTEEGKGKRKFDYCIGCGHGLFLNEDNKPDCFECARVYKNKASAIKVINKMEEETNKKCYYVKRHTRIK